MNINTIEKHDWGITDEDTGTEQFEKSKSAYYLTPDNYEKIKGLTFETEFYGKIPDILPFDGIPLMVRWENKSPKDSEYWGPVTKK